MAESRKSKWVLVLASTTLLLTPSVLAGPLDFWYTFIHCFEQNQPHTESEPKFEEGANGTSQCHGSLGSDQGICVFVNGPENYSFGVSCFDPPSGDEKCVATFVCPAGNILRCFDKGEGAFAGTMWDPEAGAHGFVDCGDGEDDHFLCSLE